MSDYNFINEGRASASFLQYRNLMGGVPFYGSAGDMQFTSTNRSQFTPGFSIKITNLTDMSVSGDPGISDFDNKVNTLRKFFKPGDRVKGIIVNSTLEDEDGRYAVGKLVKFKIDYKNQTIRAIIKDPQTLETQEIYYETMMRLFEGHKITRFSEYPKS